ncbi:TPA: hypothetical protein ACROWJ_004654, partial [Escherichia coli]
EATHKHYSEVLFVGSGFPSHPFHHIKIAFIYYQFSHLYNLNTHPFINPPSTNISFSYEK